jgi:hypothetical protein
MKEDVYEVVWKGWPKSQTTWEPASSFEHCQDVFLAYKAKMHMGLPALKAAKAALDKQASATGRKRKRTQ